VPDRMCVSRGVYWRTGRQPASAFTLLELITVVAIISLLIAIFAPTVITAMAWARTARCGSNLREISKAVAHFRAETPNGELFAEAWQTTLKPYLEGKTDIFVCSEYGGTTEEATEIALTDMVYFRVQRGSQFFQVELNENPYMVKLNDSQYWQARAEGWLNNPNSANNFPRDEWPYQDDGTGVYWLCMEDYGGDWDFKDVMTKVTNNGDGTTTLYMISGTTGHHNTLRWKSDDSEIAYIGSNNWTGMDQIVPTEEHQTSYGMNEHAQDVRFDGSKVLVMDYVWIVARPMHNWAAQIGPTPGVPRFARHMNKMNVLLSGGEVVLVRPEQIDPADPFVRAYRWEP